MKSQTKIWNVFVQLLSCVQYSETPMDCSIPGFPVLHFSRVCSNSGLLNWWCVQPFHPLESPSPPSFNLSRHHGLFKRVGSWLVWSHCSPRVPQESSPASQFESINSSVFMAQPSHPYMTTGETIALTIGTFLEKWCLCFLICCIGLW